MKRHTTNSSRKRTTRSRSQTSKNHRTSLAPAQTVAATDRYVRTHPWRMAGLAAAVGCLSGLLAGRKAIK